MRLTPFSDESVLGVDIGTHSIKIVETKLSHGKLLALRAVSQEIDFSNTSDTKSKWEAYVVALKTILSQHKISAKTAVIGVPDTAAGVKIILSMENAAEPGNHSFEAREVETYTQPLMGIGADGAPEKGSLVISAGRGAIVDRFEIARDAGLVPVIADLNIFAVLNAYLPAAGPAVKGLVFVLDIGANTTELAIGRGGLIMAVRTIFLAGNNLTVTLQRELDVPLAAAEAFKKKYGLLARVKRNKDSILEIHDDKPENKLAVKIAGLLAARVDQISAEIKRTLAYYAEQIPGPDMRIAKVVLTGGSADLPGLAEYLGGELGVPVEILRPLEKFDLRRFVGNSKAGGPCFATAAGLSMRRWPRERVKLFTTINLLPKALLRRVNYAARVFGCAVLLALLYAGYYEYKAFIKKINDEAFKNKTAFSVLKIKQEKMRKALENMKAAKNPKPPAVVRRKAAPVRDKYAYLNGLTVSGVFTDPSGASAILIGPGVSFIVKNGKMFDESGEAVKGISAAITQKSVVLSAENRIYEIAVPK